MKSSLWNISCLRRRGAYVSLRYLCLAVVLPVMVAAFGQPSRQMERMLREPSARLLDRGQRWLEKGSAAAADSALLCFSVISSRYDEDASRSDKESAARAAVGKWLVYFSYHFDYPKAYESIQEALDICRREGLDYSKVYVSLGGMLQMMGDQGGSSELYSQAVAHYASGFREAVRRGNYATADMAFINLLTSSRSLGSADTVRCLWKMYQPLPEHRNDVRRRFTKQLYRCVYGAAGWPAAARTDSILSALGRVPEEPEYLRLRFVGLKSASEMASEGGDNDRALALAEAALGFARKHGIRDGEIEASQLMAELLRILGRDSEAASAYDEYLRLKDAMLSSRGIQRLDELRFLADLRESDRRLTEAKASQQRQRLIILFLTLFGAATAAFVWVVAAKNRRLRRANDALYRQFRAGVASEERERTLRDKLQSEETVSGYTDNTSAETSPDADSIAQEDAVSAAYGRPGPAAKERDRIMEGLATVMTTPDAVCSPDCTVARLAGHVGCSPKYLSQIINEEYGCNFNTFINGYRIREAARRLTAGGEWSRFTIEAIANSVGFRSRSTFVSLFKQTTGLTPSEYRKRGQQAQKNVP